MIDNECNAIENGFALIAIEICPFISLTKYLTIVFTIVFTGNGFGFSLISIVSINTPTMNDVSIWI